LAERKPLRGSMRRVVPGGSRTPPGTFQQRRFALAASGGATTLVRGWGRGRRRRNGPLPVPCRPAADLDRHRGAAFDTLKSSLALVRRLRGDHPCTT